MVYRILEWGGGEWKEVHMTSTKSEAARSVSVMCQMYPQTPFRIVFEKKGAAPVVVAQTRSIPG